MSDLNQKERPDDQELTEGQQKMLSDLVANIPKSRKRCLIYCGDRCDCDAAEKGQNP